MISHEHKCIFIHVPKTAGESVESVFLGQPMNINGKAHPEKHLSAAEMKERYPKEFNEYFKFGIVRNPWDRYVSNVLYRQRRTDGLSDIPVETLMRQCLTLEIYHKKNPRRMLFINDDLAVDYVARFENLEEDLTHVWDTLGIENTALPKHNVSTERKPYHEYYDYYSKEFIARTQYKDIEYFDYKFEGKITIPALPGKLWNDLKVDLAIRRAKSLTQ